MNWKEKLTNFISKHEGEPTHISLVETFNFIENTDIEDQVWIVESKRSSKKYVLEAIEGEINMRDKTYLKNKVDKYKKAIDQVEKTMILAS